MRSLHPPDAEHKGVGHSPTSVLNLDFEKSDSKIASWYQVALLAQAKRIRIDYLPSQKILHHLY